MEKELREIYKMSADYMQDKDISAKEIIEKAAKVYVEHYEELPDELVNVFYDCLAYTNIWVGEGMTFKGYCVGEGMTFKGYCVELADTLVEDLCGFLGEYFND